MRTSVIIIILFSLYKFSHKNGNIEEIYPKNGKLLSSYNAIKIFNKGEGLGRM
jgi:hypothetical protein